MKIDPQLARDALAIDEFGMSATLAQAKGICVSCKRTPVLRTPLDKEEYRLSALCPECFDKFASKLGVA